MPEIVVRPSFKFIRLGYALAVLVLVAGLVAYLSVWNEYPWIIVVAALALLWPAQRHVRRQLTRAIISGDKLRYETGFLSKSTRTIQLSKIQDVRVDQTLGQRISGVGSVSIETAGETSRLTLMNIDQPQKVADEIVAAAQKGQERGEGI